MHSTFQKAVTSAVANEFLTGKDGKIIEPVTINRGRVETQ